MIDFNVSNISCGVYFNPNLIHKIILLFKKSTIIFIIKILILANIYKNNNNAIF